MRFSDGQSAVAPTAQGAAVESPPETSETPAVSDAAVVATAPSVTSSLIPKLRALKSKAKGVGVGAKTLGAAPKLPAVAEGDVAPGHAPESESTVPDSKTDAGTEK